MFSAFWGPVGFSFLIIGFPVLSVMSPSLLTLTQLADEDVVLYVPERPSRNLPAMDVI